MGSYCSTGIEFWFCKMKTVMEADGDDVCTTSIMNIFDTAEAYPLEDG